MKYGPDVSIVANLIGDPARSNMVMALMSGLSLSAAELAREAGVTPSTATGHLGKLESAGLLTCTKQGRHRYFRISDPDVAHVVEALIAVATRSGTCAPGQAPKTKRCATRALATTTLQGASPLISSSDGLRPRYCAGAASLSI